MIRRILAARAPLRGAALCTHACTWEPCPPLRLRCFSSFPAVLQVGCASAGPRCPLPPAKEPGPAARSADLPCTCGPCISGLLLPARTIGFHCEVAFYFRSMLFPPASSSCRSFYLRLFTSGRGFLYRPFSSGILLPAFSSRLLLRAFYFRPHLQAPLNDTAIRVPAFMLSGVNTWTLQKVAELGNFSVEFYGACRK